MYCACQQQKALSQEVKIGRSVKLIILYILWNVHRDIQDVPLATEPGISLTFKNRASYI
jgi:hypothetical protein